ncbi:MAG: glycosyltransferase family 2 protein [Nitrospirae bacterium]|nr:glycosyltransferase family 2 protein [Nitrospirota bacterium]
MKPKLSVILPNYNHAKYLERSLGALVEQTYRPAEIIVIDDASTDKSLEIINAFAARYPDIKLIANNTNRGSLASGNIGREHASGDYIYNTAADDRVLSGFFEKAMEMAVQYPDAGLIFGKMGMVDKDFINAGEIEIKKWQEPLYADPKRFLTDFLDSEPSSHSLCAATIYKRTAFDEVGLHSELNHWRDSFTARAIGLKYGACYIPERFVDWTILPDSFSQSGRKDLGLQISMVSNAASLMRSVKFRDRFPEDHVQRWESEYYKLILREHNKINSKEDISVQMDAIISAVTNVEMMIDSQSLINENGDCFVYSFRTNAARIFSRLPFYANSLLYEDGRPLAIPASEHDDIRNLGEGRYSMWPDSIWFSSSDHSDPRYNGRKYTIRVPAYLLFLENLPIEQIQKWGL